ncbi:MAG: D-alanine--D-alanine ligase [Candidatus Delongbacteria bacterium]|nr:D-alanine--D-alanine ligase [Candidatus Delongbacteria bacterium]
MRPHLVLICGGQSVEHEVSIISTKNILAAIPADDYQIRTVIIDQTGTWHLIQPENLLSQPDNPRRIAIDYQNLPIVILEPGHPQACLRVLSNHGNSFHQGTDRDHETLECFPVDCVWPVLHGRNGEDGTIQGMLQLFNIPFVGNGITASAIGMDKELSKRLLEAAQIPVVPYITIYKGQLPYPDFAELCRHFGSTSLFIKAAHSGSSVGIYKAHHEAEFKEFLGQSFQYDSKVLIEMGLEKPREIEIAVLQTRDEIMVSMPGEVIPKHEFYDYDAKYVDDDGAALKAPAELDESLIARLRQIARDAFRVLENEGLLRVDFFIAADGRLYLNEVNTMPGFTAISMYPRLIKLAGLSYPELIRKLIDFALAPR